MINYPVEKYIDLENNPYLLGRIIVNHVNTHFHAEVDIIHRESHKIFKHVDIIYGQPSGEEAVIAGVQKLRHYLEGLEESSKEASDKSTLH